ncbi:CD63 antigen [Amia ocellicauda]|uniref:CD63 antigen n=1 Tax=Amia ocellicauda TaxID=2972642 RepID=UPI003464E0AF|nr:CD63 protein [Amia calva]
MAVEGGMKCVKFLLFFFNFIFWLCGLALIVIGVLVQMSLQNTLRITNASASGVPIVIISVGVVIFFIAFFGCCGAWKESACMVTMFAILLTLIILVEVAAAIAGYIFKDKVRGILTESFRDLVKTYPDKPENKKVMDDMQSEFHCCGALNASDWQNNSVPDSCCKNVTLDCGKNAQHTDKIYSTGCVVVLENWIKKNLVIVIGVALGIAFFEILGVVFACMLMKAIRSGYEVM